MGAHVSHPIYQESLSQRLALEGCKCEECDTTTFPPEDICPECNSANTMTSERLSGKGTIYSYTVIAPGGVPPEFAPQARRTGEIIVGLIELVEGPWITAQLTACDQEAIAIGTKVRARIRRLYEEEGVVRYGFKFEPVGKST